MSTGVRSSRFSSLQLLAAVSLLASAGSASAQTPRDDPRGALAAEILGGTVGLAAGTMIGVAATASMASAMNCDGSGDAPCLFPVFVGIPVGVFAAMFLIPAGVGLAADETGGSGSYWASLLGSTLVIAPGSAMLILARPPDELLFPALGGLAALWVAGAIAGYRVSAPDDLNFVVSPAGQGDGAMLTISGRL